MASESEKQNRLWATFVHLSAFVGLFIPLGNILAPLIIWLLKRNESSLVDEEGKKSLNFQVSITIYSVIAGILTVILIGIPLLIALVIYDVVTVIIASIKTNNGEKYNYKFSLHLIK
ncbi:MAG: DUF4870 domain-containing protein [Candidatus Daviesbacteria bacterium]